MLGIDSRRRKNVAASGFYGMENFGDELFRTVVQCNAEHLWGDVRVIDSAPAPGSRLSRWHSSYTLAGAALRFGRTMLLLARCGRVALCGGSTLSRLSPNSLIQATAVRLGLRRGDALGVSVGPFANAADEASIARYISHLDRLVVRDRRSYTTATELGTRTELGGDLAALYPYPQRARDTSHIRVGLAPCVSAGESSEAYSNRVGSALLTFQSDSSKPLIVDVLALNSHPTIGDSAKVTDIARRLRDVGLTVTTAGYSDLGVDGMVRRIATLDSLVSTRLHGWVVAYLLHTGFVVDAYHAKSHDIADDIGVPSILRVTPQSGSAAVLTAIRISLEPSSCAMRPSEYVARAQSVYLGTPQ